MTLHQTVQALPRKSQVKIVDALALNQRFWDYETSGNKNKAIQVSDAYADRLDTLTESEMATFTELFFVETDWVRQLSLV